MKTIALRFGEQFSPDCGTIAAHQAVIDELGYVWYGKLGNPVRKNIAKELISQDDLKILLIHSGKYERYWAHVVDIKWNIPNSEGIPSYYRDMTDKFKTWFKISSFEPAPKNILSKCLVISSGALLGEVSSRSMSPYFIISYDESESEK